MKTRIIKTPNSTFEIYDRDKYDDPNYTMMVDGMPTTESFRMTFIDLGAPITRKVSEFKEYEIWTGPYDLGQGHHGSTKPELWGKETAINFQVACIKHELKTKLESIEKQELQGYVDSQSMEWFYNQRTNANSWIGKYYETEAEALKSFKK